MSHWYPPAALLTALQGYQPSAGTGQFLSNPPFVMSPTTESLFKAGEHVLMRNRIRDDVVKVLAVTDRSVVVEGTEANFCPATGKQITFDNCWPDWRIEPLIANPPFSVEAADVQP